MNSFDFFGNSSNKDVLQSNNEHPEFMVSPDTLDQTIEEDRPVRPINGLLLTIFVFTILLGVQCYRLQVTQGAQNNSLAQGNSIRIITTQPDRGLITDTNGTILAQNTHQLALAINPQTLPSKLAKRQIVYTQLKAEAGISQDTINFIEKNRDATPNVFAIKTNISKDDGLIYQEEFANTPGVTIQETPIRNYGEFPSSGQILGYVGSTNAADIIKGFTPNQKVGKGGLEAYYNTLLMGTEGKEKAEVDAAGDIVRQLPGSGTSDPQAGNTLKLSLDVNLQQTVANALEGAITQRAKTFGDATKNLGASAVIMDPNNGAILAMVSLPDYSANLFAGGISQTTYDQLLNNPADPLLNRTIQGLYPSGSAVKPLIAATALQDGVISANQTLDTSQSIKIGQSTFPDWKFHPSSNVKLAIAQSNDIFFYAVGGGLASQNVKGLGIDNLNKGLDAFGLGSQTGVDLPGESAGLTPGPTWKESTQSQPWYIGDTYHQSIGQGYLLVTPLQMAAAIAAIANGGTLYQPQLGWSLTNPTTGKETLLPHKVLNSNWISPANLQTVQQGMEMTTQPGGTAQLLGKFGVTTAGKTGTAQFGNDGLTHSWYVGYAPVDHPQYAYAILIEGDGNVTEATESSEPVAEEILRAMFNKPLAPGQQLDSQALFPTLPSSPTPTPTP